MNIDSASEYFMAVAMTSIKYCEELNKDQKKQANTLGYVYRVYQEEVRCLLPQELSLLITFLSNIKEEYYKEYINLFDKKILSAIIEKSKSIEEQISSLEKIEDIYYEFACDIDLETLKIIKSLEILED